MRPVNYRYYLSILIIAMALAFTMLLAAALIGMFSVPVKAVDSMGVRPPLPPTIGTPYTPDDSAKKVLTKKQKKKRHLRRIAARDHSAWVEQVRKCIRHRESRGQYDAKNPSSTASGAYQFLDSTWKYTTRLQPPARAYGKRVQDGAFYKLFANGKGRNNWYYPGGQQCW